MGVATSVCTHIQYVCTGVRWVCPMDYVIYVPSIGHRNRGESSHITHGPNVGQVLVAILTLEEGQRQRLDEQAVIVKGLEASRHERDDELGRPLRAWDEVHKVEDTFNPHLAVDHVLARLVAHVSDLSARPDDDIR